jgi:hypothetical protein
MAFDTTSSFSSSSLWLDFESESITAQRSFAFENSIRGTRSQPQERTRTAPYKVGGNVTFAADISTMDMWLKYILGSGPASSVYSLSESLTAFYLMIDRGAKVFTYGPCYVSKAKFSAAPGSPLLKVSIDVEAETESVGNSGTFPTGMAIDTHRPFIYSDCAFNYNATSYSSFGFELTIDNHLLADRFVNEITRSQIPAVDRTVHCKLTTPWTSTETALYNIAAGSFAQLTATFSNAEETISSTESVLTFTMPWWQFPGVSPHVTGKAAETHLELSGQAMQTGTTKELTVTNAHG